MNASSSDRSSWVRRVVALCAAVFVATLTSLFISASPAAAASLTFTFSEDPVELKSNEEKSVTVTVTGGVLQDSKSGNITVDAAAFAGLAEVTLEQGDCAVSGMTAQCGEIEARATKTFTVKFKGTPDAVPADTTQSPTLNLSADHPDNGRGTLQVNITGVAASVPGITGKVIDFKSEPIAGAEISLKDAKGKTHTATSGDDGAFTINQEVASGEATYTVEKEGFETKKDEKVNIAPGTAFQDMEVRMEAVVKEDKSEEAAPEEAADDTAEDESGFSTSVWVMIILGGLLVLGGIVAIVLLIRKGRNKSDEDDLEPLPDVAPIHQPTATQTGQLGVYDAVTRRPGTDAPTMIHNGPLIDDDLARYGGEPASSPGFGPAYGDDRPTRLSPQEPDSRSTRMMPARDGGFDPGEPRSFHQTPTTALPEPPSTQKMPSADPGYGRGADSYGRDQGYGREPGYGQDPGYGRDPGYRRDNHAEPNSGYGRELGRDNHAEPNSGYGRELGRDSGYGQNSGYGRNPEPPAPRYPAEPEAPRYGRDSAPGYAGGDQGDHGYGRDQGYRAPEPPAEPPRSRPRHYRDDQDDDRPQSW